MRLNEVAQELGVSPATVRGWRHTNWKGFKELPHGGYPVEYERGEQLDKWIKAYKRGEFHTNLADCLRHN